MDEFTFLVIAHFLFIIVAVLTIKNLIHFIRLAKQGETERFSLAPVQKRSICILCILIYVLVFLFAIYSELADGNGAVSGLKTGLLISIANTLRFPYSFVAFALLFLYYYDYKTRTRRRGSEINLPGNAEEHE